MSLQPAVGLLTMSETSCCFVQADAKADVVELKSAARKLALIGGVETNVAEEPRGAVQALMPALVDMSLHSSATTTVGVCCAMGFLRPHTAGTFSMGCQAGTKSACASSFVTRDAARSAIGEHGWHNCMQKWPKP